MTLILNGTVGVSDVDGSAATPAIRGTDANTGMFFPAADTIAFAEGGTEVMRIDSSGNVGIGTSSPAASLSVTKQTTTLSGTGNAYGLYMYPTSSGLAYIDAVTSASGNTSLGFRTYNNGTYNDAVRIDSSGNVGIGTSSPTQKLQVSGAIATGSIRQSTLTNAFNNFWCDGGSTTNSGFTGVYNSSGTRIAYLGFWDSNNIVNMVEGNFGLTFGTNNTERARIDTSGSLNVGGTGANNGGAILHAERSTSAVVGRYFATQSSGYTSDVLQAITTQGSSTSCTIFGAYYSGGAAFAFRVRGDGTIYAQNTTVQSASDARFKENIVDATDGLNVVSALRPVRFDLKEGHGVSAKQNQLGFIAQEVQKVFPDAVDVWKESDDPENPYLSLGTSALIPVLVKAIQELKAQNDELKARVEALEGN